MPATCSFEREYLVCWLRAGALLKMSVNQFFSTMSCKTRCLKTERLTFLWLCIWEYWCIYLLRLWGRNELPYMKYIHLSAWQTSLADSECYIMHEYLLFSRRSIWLYIRHFFRALAPCLLSSFSRVVSGGQRGWRKVCEVKTLANFEACCSAQRQTLNKRTPADVSGSPGIHIPPHHPRRTMFPLQTAAQFYLLHRSTTGIRL